MLRRLFQHLPMTESQVLESTKALNALETSHPGQIPQSILSSVQPNKSPIISPSKKNDPNKTGTFFVFHPDSFPFCKKQEFMFLPVDLIACGFFYIQMFFLHIFITIEYR